MRLGEGPVKKYNRDSLRILGSVGEPINPEAWLWYHRVVGDSRCAIVDTWWQTETGGTHPVACPSPVYGAPIRCVLTHFLFDDDPRRHSHYAAARRYAHEAGIGDEALLRRAARRAGRKGTGAGRPVCRLPGHQPAVARNHAHRLRRSRSFRADLYVSPACRQGSESVLGR